MSQKFVTKVVLFSKLKKGDALEACRLEWRECRDPFQSTVHERSSSPLKGCKSATLIPNIGGKRAIPRHRSWVPWRVLATKQMH